MSQNFTPSLIKDIVPGAGSSNPEDLISFNGELFFTVNFDLWKSDGTTDGTVNIDDDALFGTSFRTGTSILEKVGDRVLLNSSLVGGLDISNTIFSTDFTPEGTDGVFSTNTNSRFTSARISDFIEFNNGLAFVSTFVDVSSLRIPDVRTSLIVRDDTSDTTSSIKTFEFEGGSSISGLTNVNGTLFFAVSGSTFLDDIEGELATNNELWKSDGTEAGTVILKDIKPGLDSSFPRNLTDINGTLFFSADDGSNGRELWKSDGTNSGTVVIKDINPSEASSNPDKLTDVNGTAFFIANDGTNGNELWKSDGTNSGTVLVKDIIPGSEGSNLDKLTNVNGTLFFTVNDSANGTELWKSDGTVEGTDLVKDINPDGDSNPENLTNIDGVLYFSADDGSNGRELWKSDGTADGTILVGDINPGSASSNPEDFTELNSEIYFSADDGVNGRELWGLTEDGTETNKDLILGGSSNDVLSGNEQGNILDGLKGNDTLDGGSGKDKFVLSGDFDNDVITDFTLGEDEIINATDKIVLTVGSSGDALKVAFSNTGDLLQVNLNGNEQGELENYLLSIGSDRALPY